MSINEHLPHHFFSLIWIVAAWDSFFCQEQWWTTVQWPTYMADNSDRWELQLASIHPGVLSGSSQGKYSWTWKLFLRNNLGCKIMSQPQMWVRTIIYLGLNCAILTPVRINIFCIVLAGIFERFTDCYLEEAWSFLK